MIVTLFFVAIIIGVLFTDAYTDTIYSIGTIKNLIQPTGWNGVCAILCNMLVIAITATQLTFLTSRYELVKEQTLLPALFFLLFQALNSSLINNFAGQNIATMLVWIATFILYACYQQDNTTEKGFLITLLLATASLFYGRILYFLPIFFLGMLQMQAASPRTTAAMIIGLITPYWITWGMGWIEGSQLDFTTLAMMWKLPPITPQFLSVAFVMLLGLCVGGSNMLNALNENIHTRAMNGFINIMSVYTAILMIIDLAHYNEYLPLLNSCVALQATYYFTTQNNRLNTIVFYGLIVLIIAFLAWSYWF